MSYSYTITVEIFQTEALVRALDMHDANVLLENRFVYKLVPRLESWSNHAECTIKAVLDTNVRIENGELEDLLYVAVCGFSRAYADFKDINELTSLIRVHVEQAFKALDHSLSGGNLYVTDAFGRT